MDSLAEACELISDVDSAQRYKTEADHLAATFYGPSRTSSPPGDPPVSPQDPASPRESASSHRDPASSRRFIGAQSPASPPATDVDAVSETSIREGVATMISRLGLASPGPDDVEDSLSIRQAERDLQETVSKTGGADVMGLSVPSHSTSSSTVSTDNSSPSGRPSSSSRRQTTTVTQQDTPVNDDVNSHTSSANGQSTLSQHQVRDTPQHISSSSSLNTDRRTDQVDQLSPVHDHRRQKSPTTNRSQSQIHGSTIG